MNPLKSISGTIIGGFVLAVILVLVTKSNHAVDPASIIIWLHVLAGITWIGLLYYFNFVQVPALAAAAGDDGGPGGAGITKYVAPRALWWFRWGALATWLTGASYLLHLGQLDDAFARLDDCGADEDLIALTKHCLELDPKDDQIRENLQKLRSNSRK